MQTLAELGALLHRTLSLAWAARTRLIAWYALGVALHTIGLQSSAILGADHDLLATLAFVAGVTASLLTLIAMIGTLRPGLRTLPLLPDPRPATVPGGLLRPERFVDLMTATLAPFLAVYAVWGFVEEQARALFRANIAEFGTGGTEEWSISWAPDRLGFYLALLAGSWVVRFVLQRLGRRYRWPAAPGVLAEAVVVFATFAALFILGGQLRSWLATRAVVVGARAAWSNLVAALPDLRLPFDLTLPRFVAAAADWLWSTALPALGTGILLPLMWLALTAVVFGWRDWRAAAVVAGTPAARLSRAGAARAARTTIGRRLRGTVRRSSRARSLALFATADLRTKYIPVLQALRFALAGGPRLVGVYLVLATALSALHGVLLILITLLIGPVDGRLALALDPATELVAGLITQPLLIALYVATFDRALAAVLTAAAAPAAPRWPTPPPAPVPALRRG